MGDGIEATERLAGAAGGAGGGLDVGDLGTVEGMRFLWMGVDEEGEIGGVNIGIDEEGMNGVGGLGGEMSEAGGEAGFAGATFATEDDELFHARLLLRAWCWRVVWMVWKRLRNCGMRVGSCSMRGMPWAMAWA